MGCGYAQPTTETVLCALSAAEAHLTVNYIHLPNRRRDYEEKRYEYRARGIRKYWIIDPEHQKVIVLLWDEEGDFYEQEEYRDDQSVACQVFPDFRRTANQILRARED